MTAEAGWCVMQADGYSGHEQRRFLIGFEVGLNGVRFPSVDDEFIWLGFTWGNLERMRLEGRIWKYKPEYSIWQLLWTWLKSLKNES
jgi:hypothetical protein